jgi:hypothetical protein
LNQGFLDSRPFFQIERGDPAARINKEDADAAFGGRRQQSSSETTDEEQRKGNKPP